MQVLKKCSPGKSRGILMVLSLSVTISWKLLCYGSNFMVHYFMGFSLTMKKYKFEIVDNENWFIVFSLPWPTKDKLLAYIGVSFAILCRCSVRYIKLREVRLYYTYNTLLKKCRKLPFLNYLGGAHAPWPLRNSCAD